jgi:predicted RNase H-like HicB family nuclease
MYEEGKWVVQCLEFDVAAQGDTIREALNDWRRAYTGQLMAYLDIEENPYERIAPAPKFYWNTWGRAEDLTPSNCDSPGGVGQAFRIKAQPRWGQDGALLRVTFCYT